MTSVRNLGRTHAVNAGAAMLLLCLGGAAAAQNDPRPIHIRVYAKAQEPQFFFYANYNSCREKWVDDRRGCLASMQIWIRRNDIAQYRLGNVDLDPGDRVYFVPLCRGRLDWKNAEMDIAQENHWRELRCRP